MITLKYTNMITLKYKGFNISKFDVSTYRRDCKEGIVSHYNFMYWITLEEKESIEEYYLHTNAKLYPTAAGMKPEDHDGWYHTPESAKRVIDKYLFARKPE